MASRTLWSSGRGLSISSKSKLAVQIEVFAAAQLRRVFVRHPTVVRTSLSLFQRISVTWGLAGASQQFIAGFVSRLTFRGLEIGLTVLKLFNYCSLDGMFNRVTEINMAHVFPNLLARFASDERGHIAIIFSVALVPLITVVSLAIDYGRALKTNSQLSAAADAATAAVLHRLPATVDDLKPFVRTQLDANLPQHLKKLPFDLVVSEKRRVVQLNVETQVPTALIALVGIDKLDVSVVSTQRIPKVASLAGSIGGVGSARPADMRAAEEALRRAASDLGLGGGGSSSGERPSREQVRKIADELNKKLEEALKDAGNGNINLDAIQSALGN